MIKVQFTSNYGMVEKFHKLCEQLGVECHEDKNFKKMLFGCCAPDVGYIVDIDSFEPLKNLSKRELWVENLMEY